MRFIDEAEILVQAGRGGNGCKSFLREKFRPRGGPDGGDGGKGGDVFFVSDRERNTLLELHLRKQYRAGAGKHGRGKHQHGRKGKDLTILVPVGTLLRDTETRSVVADLSRPGQRFLAAKGGRGGQGNARFVTASCKLPEFSERGGPGESRGLHCELKLLADVGIVGLPNAGKSTLVGSLSSAKPKIAEYPFTTLVPQLGLVKAAEDQTFVITDIPGILPGAADGVGLGIRFLKHIERTSVLLFLIDLADSTRDDPFDTYQELETELSRFSEGLLQKSKVVAFNKTDLPLSDQRKASVLAHPSFDDASMFFISALTGKGLRSLARHLFHCVQGARRNEAGRE